MTEQTTHDVYGTDDNWFFSAGIKRAFGVNKIVTLNSGEQVFSVVTPLKCDPSLLKKVGTIQIAEDEYVG